MSIPMLRKDTAKFLQGGKLCVFTYVNLEWPKGKKFSKFCDAVPTGLKSGGRKWCLRPNRVIRCQPLQNLSTTLNIMFGLLSKNLTRTVLRLWNRSLVRAVRPNLPRMTRLLSRKRRNVRQTFWIAPSNAGLWKNCESIFSRKKSFLRLALKHFAGCCMKTRSGSGEPRPGRNATTRSSSLKKTDTQICKPACTKWPDGVIRRIRSVGSSASARTGLVSYRPSQKTAGHLHSSARRSALAGVLRCPSEKDLGLCPTPQKASGDTWGVA